MRAKLRTAAKAKPSNTPAPEIKTRMGQRLAAAPQFLDRVAVAEMLGVSKDLVINMQKAGLLKAYKVGVKSVRYKLSEVQEAIDAREMLS